MNERLHNNIFDNGWSNSNILPPIMVFLFNVFCILSMNWKGKELKKKINRVTAASINETAKDCVVHAINNHPGWQYDTGVAEGSVTQKVFATPNKLRALWGSVWTIRGKSNYVWYLEFKHGSFLRNAADVVYPSLAKRIKKRLK